MQEFDKNIIPFYLLPFFEKEVITQPSEAHALEKATVFQVEIELWLSDHTNRITASNFGKVLFKQQKLSEAMLKHIFCSKSLPNVKSTAHGKENAKVARSIYSNKVQTKVSGFTVFDAGISENTELPFVGATPDGKVYDPSENPPHDLVEIKCPFSKINDTAFQAELDRKLYLEDRNGSSFKVDHSPGYYYQVQGQLAITGLT